MFKPANFCWFLVKSGAVGKRWGFLFCVSEPTEKYLFSSENSREIHGHDQRANAS